MLCLARRVKAPFTGVDIRSDVIVSSCSFRCELLSTYALTLVKLRVTGSSKQARPVCNSCSTTGDKKTTPLLKCTVHTSVNVVNHADASLCIVTSEKEQSYISMFAVNTRHILIALRIAI